jgi:septal ring factor EnvC (AmiA/AmiB activator)
MMELTVAMVLLALSALFCALELRKMSREAEHNAQVQSQTLNAVCAAVRAGSEETLRLSDRADRLEEELRAVCDGLPERLAPLEKAGEVLENTERLIAALEDQKEAEEKSDRRVAEGFGNMMTFDPFAKKEAGA